jgi:murein DD-endopeptidase MepM/ murein hydrolase activator NlpD
MQTAIAKYDPQQAVALGAIAMAETGGTLFPSWNAVAGGHWYHGPWAFQDATLAGMHLNANQLDGNLDYAAKAAASLASTGITHGKWETWPAMAAKYMGGGVGSGSAAAVPVANIAPAGSASTDCPANAPGGGGGGGDLVSAGEAVVHAFGQCQSGLTNLGNDACVNGSLRKAGYTDKQVSQFNTRRAGSVDSAGYTECLGFASLALTLAYGDTNPLPVSNARDVLNSSSYRMGAAKFTRVAAGQAPQPGDIGIALPGPGDGGGNHALIVKEPKGSTFIAVEGNFRARRATDSISHTTATYAYYRTQSLGGTASTGGWTFPLQTTQAIIERGSQDVSGGLEVWCYTSQSNCHHTYNAADIMAPTGTTVLAPVSGVVVTTSPGLGPTACVYANRGDDLSIKGDDGRAYFMGHMGLLTVSTGQRVASGQPVGQVGTACEAQATVPHLHIQQNPAGDYGGQTTSFNVQPVLTKLFTKLPA